MNEALIALSGLSAIAYFVVWLRAERSYPRSIVKALAVAALALLSLHQGGPLMLTAALALSALGDLFISRAGERMFLAGLLSFFAAHLAYVALFFEIATEPRLWAFALLLAYSAVLSRWLWPHLGEMRGPVAGYVAVIMAMASAAFAAPLALWPIILGAVLFAISDSVLAAETFVFRDRPKRWTAPVIWPTYYAAQALFAVAYLSPGFADAIS